jgi:argininosuccinate lyase
MSKLWKSDTNINQKVEKFTIGQDLVLDLQLARYDVLGTMAHIRMLHKIDLLSTHDLSQLTLSLKKILQKIAKREFIIEDGVEDIHSQVELDLTRELGEIGKKVHSGRSRNDQVLLDLKLFIRAELEQVVEYTNTLFKTLQSLSEQYKHILMPGYTHMQVAMPSSFGLWFGAYAEALVDDILLIHSAFELSNQNPLGSAAGYGSSFPLDRQMTTDLLGFDQPNYNVVYAQMGRGKVERVVSFALANLGATLSKMAMDICLYNGQNFAFLRFPEGFTTGSSIMPHKKNPDIFELIRAKGNQLQALPQEMSFISGNLPSGYHRDFQILKERFFPAFTNLKDCLEVANLALNQVEIREDITSEAQYDYLFTVEEVNRLVLQGTPFREAYQQVAASIKAGEYKAQRELNHTHLGSIGNLGTEQIKQKMEKSLSKFPFDKIKEAFSYLQKG